MSEQNKTIARDRSSKRGERRRPFWSKRREGMNNNLLSWTHVMKLAQIDAFGNPAEVVRAVAGGSILKCPGER
jgi:hypothetical protein